MVAYSVSVKATGRKLGNVFVSQNHSDAELRNAIEELANFYGYSLSDVEYHTIKS